MRRSRARLLPEEILQPRAQRALARTVSATGRARESIARTHEVKVQPRPTAHSLLPTAASRAFLSSSLRLLMPSMILASSAGSSLMRVTRSWLGTLSAAWTTGKCSMRFDHAATCGYGSSERPHQKWQRILLRCKGCEGQPRSGGGGGGRGRAREGRTRAASTCRRARACCRRGTPCRRGGHREPCSTAWSR